METDPINTPLVSVIIPAHNSRAYIGQTIDSVLAQTYRPLEVIVVDDGSTDGTSPMLAAQFGGQISIYQQPKRGAASARNYGYSLAKGQLIKFLDADDLINPDMVRLQTEAAMHHPGSIVSASWGRFHHDDPDTFELNPEACWATMPALDWLLSSWEHTASMTNPGLFLIPRQLIEVAGPWDESLSRLDDTEYFARTILSAPQVAFSAGSVLYYRSGLPDNLSGKRSRGAYLSAYMAYEKTAAMILLHSKSRTARLVCANIWQRFLYDTYPDYPDLAKQARQHIKSLVRPTLPYEGGRMAKLLARIIGWRAVRKIQLFLKQH